MEEKTRGISGSTLKIIALITMFIDHAGVALLESRANFLLTNYLYEIFPYSQDPITMTYFIMRSIGRIAFPIFCFLLVEGFRHTRDVKKYATRLLIFAFISEVPFDLALQYGRVSLNYQNIFFTLFIGLMTIYFMDRFRDKRLFAVIIFIAGCYLTELFRTDYGLNGIVAIALFYIAGNSKIKQVFANFVGFLFEIANWAAAYLSIPLIYFYNGKRGINLKYVFYAFYPIHLLLLYLIGRFIM